jgi:hypothetical protein
MGGIAAIVSVKLGRGVGEISRLDRKSKYLGGGRRETGDLAGPNLLYSIQGLLVL